MEPAEPDGAEELLPQVYNDLRKLADRMLQDQFRQHTLQPTALVHEAYMRLAKGEASGWTDRQHFMAVASIAMRQLLRDYARDRNALKRSAQGRRIELEDVDEAAEGMEGIDVVALDEALDELSALDERVARTVELRFLGGLTAEETAEVLGVSTRTVFLDWKMAKAWLEKRLGGEAPDREAQG